MGTQCGFLHKREKLIWEGILSYEIAVPSQHWTWMVVTTRALWASSICTVLALWLTWAAEELWQRSDPWGSSPLGCWHRAGSIPTLGNLRSEEDSPVFLISGHHGPKGRRTARAQRFSKGSSPMPWNLRPKFLTAALHKDINCRDKGGRAAGCLNNVSH